MFHRFTAVYVKEDGGYVAHCLELGVVSQGDTLEEAEENLREAVSLYIESFGVENLPNGHGEFVVDSLEVAAGG